MSPFAERRKDMRVTFYELKHLDCVVVSSLQDKFQEVNVYFLIWASTFT